MTNHEIGTHFEASPESFIAGREAMRSFSPDNKQDKEPDYDEMIERGQKRLLEVIENGDESDENVVFSREFLIGLNGKKKKPNPWEPFGNDSSRDRDFLNLYTGPFSDDLEIHRPNVERILDVADINGKVVFRNASIESENKYDLVSDSSGWLVEFDGNKTLVGLEESLGRKPIEQRFAAATDKILRSALVRLMIKEKLTPEKDGALLFGLKALISSMPIPYMIEFHGIGKIPFNELALLFDAIAITWIYGGANLLYGKIIKNWKDRLILPPLEIDRVARGLLFANIKGRNLVRLAAR